MLLLHVPIDLVSASYNYETADTVTASPSERSDSDIGLLDCRVSTTTVNLIAHIFHQEKF
jgi:hypothetical protein